MNESKQKYVSYNDMRKEIQERILALLKAADRDFRDVSLITLRAQFKFDYGIGDLTIDRLIDNMVKLGVVIIKGDLIQSAIKKIVPQKAAEEPQERFVPDD